MRCYKCGATLTASDRCPQCKADVSVYKRAAKASNAYYNLGLAKAKVRDLTGAAESLKTSVMIHKNNIEARNLLGLPSGVGQQSGRVLYCTDSVESGQV